MNEYNLKNEFCFLLIFIFQRNFRLSTKSNWRPDMKRIQLFRCRQVYNVSDNMMLQLHVFSPNYNQPLSRSLYCVGNTIKLTLKNITQNSG